MQFLNDVALIWIKKRGLGGFLVCFQAVIVVFLLRHFLDQIILTRKMMFDVPHDWIRRWQLRDIETSRAALVPA